ncbi:MAG TPA: hypothetical protein VE343_12600, partial [Streptosporangiaceae bacterium]|nr:hypothetical protein [Streptosporangiaceae bacterium]
RIADRQQRWSNELPGIELGYRYLSSPLTAPANGSGPDPDSFRYTPTTWPGARLPHLWLDDGTAVQDHLGRCYTLLHTRAAGTDLRQLAHAFAAVGAPFASFEIRSAGAAQVYEGYWLILVRPDLHVVWRGRDRLPDPGWLAALATGRRCR